MLGREYDAALTDAYHMTSNQLTGQGVGAQADLDGALAIAREVVAQSPMFSELPPLSDDEREEAAKSVVDDLFLLGPLEPLLADERVTEIMVNAPDDVRVETAGKIVPTDVRFRDDAHVMRIIQRICGDDNRTCDSGRPMCDCTLHRSGAAFDGSRVNAVAMPIAVDHPYLDIRKFRNDKLTVESLIESGTMDERQANFLEALVLARMNVIIMGGTGSGKTTLLNAVSNFIPDEQRIITVEDTVELKLAKTHVLRMEARQANIEGTGEVTIRQIIKNTLRQRPDRIIVGECRGAEAFDMLQAMGTGHDGSLTTLHANDCRSALARLQMMIQMNPDASMMPASGIMKVITDAVDFVVNVRRYPDGTRKVAEIAEVQGMQGEVATLATISKFIQDGTDSKGYITGEFRPTGDRISPDHRSRFENNGVEVDDWWFSPWDN